MSALVSFVQTELRKLPPDRSLNFKNGGGWIRCPLHAGGMESTPSGKVNLDPTAPAPVGHYWCWGCHQKMFWNDFANLFNLQKMTGGMVREAGATLNIVDKGKDPIAPDYREMMEWAKEMPWRSIPGKLINKYNGRVLKFGRETRLYLPVTVYGENMGGIYAALTKAKTEYDKSYINSDGEWSKKSLLGFDRARKKRGPLWVVEGPRDTFHVANCGCRVVGLIGSGVFRDKIALIKDIDPPSVLIATDPDEAGDDAADTITASLDGLIPVRRLPLKRNEETNKKIEDPADLPPDKILKANKAMIKMFGKGD